MNEKTAYVVPALGSDLCIRQRHGRHRVVTTWRREVARPRGALPPRRWTKKKDK